MAVLTPSQISACVIAERIASSISVVGIAMILTLYCSVRSFRGLMSNRLLVCASIANIVCNAATLMGGSGLVALDSALCQSQAFLLEWFMQTDPMFGACMAIDVYLVMFHRWTPTEVGRLLNWYLLACYGMPLIPALFCLLYRDKNGHKIYGGAGIWCWVDNEYAVVRIYSYYAVIWSCLLVTLFIYTRVGLEIIQRRSAIRAYSNHGRSQPRSSLQPPPSIDLRASRTPTLIPLPMFTGTRTTNVEVTTAPTSPTSITFPATTHKQPSTTREAGNFVDISAGEPDRRSLMSTPKDWYVTMRRGFSHLDKVTIAYMRCAGLFALSIIVTWVPSSANRVYSLLHPSDPSYVLNLLAAAVLPLQGFWNTVIFFWTSWSIVGREYQRIRRARAQKKDVHRVAERGQNEVDRHKVSITESGNNILGKDDTFSISDHTGNNSIRATSERSTTN